MKIMTGAESFFLEGTSERAVLLIHGYTGAPSEMRLLGEYLNNMGFTVQGVRLPGHGTTPEDLNETTTVDWYDEAERTCCELLSRYPKVMVAGLSMGGLLTIKLASQLPIQRAAILAAPIFLQDKRVPLFPILRHFIKYLPKQKRNYHETAMYNVAYDRMPTKPIDSILKMIKIAKTEYLPKIEIPCLVIQSKIEHTVNPKSAQYIYDNIKSKLKRLVWLEHCGHILTLDTERDKVFKLVGDFFLEDDNNSLIF